MMSLLPFSPWKLIGAAAIGLICGCGSEPELASVSGSVLLNGQPLADALVLFTPTDGGRPSGARTDENGEYELAFTQQRSGALLGEHVVRISTGRDGDPDSDLAPSAELVPLQYNEASEVTRTVETGHNAHHFQLIAAEPSQRRLATQRH